MRELGLLYLDWSAISDDGGPVSVWVPESPAAGIAVGLIIGLSAAWAFRRRV